MDPITSEGIYAINLSTPGVSGIIESIVLIHAACILNDNTLVTFLPPLSHSQITESWQGLLEQTSDQESRFILVSVSKVASRSSSSGPLKTESPFKGDSWPVLPTNEDLEISGVVSLSSSPESQTGPFRGVVQRLLVSPLHRRKGLATKLVAELEKRALAMGRWSLMLDTEVGSPAELLYPRLGYETLGVVREYGISPRDGKTLVDEKFFWKDLRKGTRTATPA
ncbi:hypothetical protein DV737_g1153, partial [Chaetothyriales sp. CBS 132003]